jgi:hypothetical protein
MPSDATYGGLPLLVVDEGEGDSTDNHVEAPKQTSVRRTLTAVVIGLALVACFLAASTTTSTNHQHAVEFAGSHVDGEIMEKAATERKRPDFSAKPKMCGGVALGNIVDERNLNNFSSLPMMQAHGWVFLDFVNPATQFDPDMHAPAGKQLNTVYDGAYYGFSYPGNGKLELTLAGDGYINFNVGNTNEFGNVGVELNGDPVGATGRANRESLYSVRFVNGDKITFFEVGNGILMINFVYFSCGPTAVPEGTVMGNDNSVRFHPKKVTPVQWPSPTCPPCPGGQRRLAEAHTFDALAQGVHQNRANVDFSRQVRSCGAVDAKNQIAAEHDLNNFSKSAGMAGMQKHGWIFEDFKGPYEFEPPLHAPAGQQLPRLDGSYYGWSFPGHGALKLKLRGNGHVRINAGNANQFGYLEVSLDESYVAALAYSTRRNAMVRPFRDGQTLTFREHENAITMIQFVEFCCDGDPCSGDDATSDGAEAAAAAAAAAALQCSCEPDTGDSASVWPLAGGQSLPGTSAAGTHPPEGWHSNGAVDAICVDVDRDMASQVACQEFAIANKKPAYQYSATPSKCGICDSPKAITKGTAAIKKVFTYRNAESSPYRIFQSAWPLVAGGNGLAGSDGAGNVGDGNAAGGNGHDAICTNVDHDVQDQDTCQQEAIDAGKVAYQYSAIPSKCGLCDSPNAMWTGRVPVNQIFPYRNDKSSMYGVYSKLWTAGSTCSGCAGPGVGKYGGADKASNGHSRLGGAGGVTFDTPFDTGEDAICTTVDYDGITQAACQLKALTQNKMAYQYSAVPNKCGICDSAAPIRTGRVAVEQVFTYRKSYTAPTPYKIYTENQLWPQFGGDNSICIGIDHDAPTQESCQREALLQNKVAYQFSMFPPKCGLCDTAQPIATGYIGVQNVFTYRQAPNLKPGPYRVFYRFWAQVGVDMAVCVKVDHDVQSQAACQKEAIVTGHLAYQYSAIPSKCGLCNSATAIATGQIPVQNTFPYRTIASSPYNIFAMQAPLWSQHGEDNSVCTKTDISVLSRDRCQEAAISQGRAAYQYSHNPSKCGLCDSAAPIAMGTGPVNELFNYRTDTSSPYRIYSPRPGLRFPVGEAVLVNVPGTSGWQRGKVAAHYDNGKPYLVELDKGLVVDVPADVNDYIKAAPIEAVQATPSVQGTKLYQPTPDCGKTYNFDGASYSLLCPDNWKCKASGRRLPDTPRRLPHTFNYKKGENGVYSNDKYLADFMHGMNLEKCKDYCSNWQSVCPHVCEEKKACYLSDDVNARHFTRDESCKKRCVAFNMHNEEHCTLFGENLKLLHGGRATNYHSPSFNPFGDHHDHDHGHRDHDRGHHDHDYRPNHGHDHEDHDHDDSYRMGPDGVYSNNKYLADFQHGMDLEKCEHYCTNWKDVCPRVCKEKKSCYLSDDVNARHFTRDTSCQKTCVAFNMHSKEHCTLFSGDLKLLDGGRAQNYHVDGFDVGGENGHRDHHGHVQEDDHGHHDHDDHHDHHDHAQKDDDFVMNHDFDAPGYNAESHHFRLGRDHVYSNSKYLADFWDGVDVDKCKNYCNSWKATCPDVCKSEERCYLSDAVGVRHFTRDRSCTLKCIGFNMHGPHHCTLFADNLKLLHGGKGVNHYRGEGGVPEPAPATPVQTPPPTPEQTPPPTQVSTPSATPVLNPLPTPPPTTLMTYAPPQGGTFCITDPQEGDLNKCAKNCHDLTENCIGFVYPTTKQGPCFAVVPNCGAMDKPLCDLRKDDYQYYHLKP